MIYYAWQTSSNEGPVGFTATRRQFQRVIIVDVLNG